MVKKANVGIRQSAIGSKRQDVLDQASVMGCGIH